MYKSKLDEDGLEDVKPSEELALGEGFLAIVAGADTTATAITNALYFLLKHPEVKKRLQEEISKALSMTPGDADYTKFMELPYFNACMWVTSSAISCQGLCMLICHLEEMKPSDFFLPALLVFNAS